MQHKIRSSINTLRTCMPLQPFRFHLTLPGVLTALMGGATSTLSWPRSRTTSSLCPTMNAVRSTARASLELILATTLQPLGYSSTGLWAWTPPNSSSACLGTVTTTPAWVSARITSALLRRCRFVEWTAVMLQVSICHLIPIAHSTECVLYIWDIGSRPVPLKWEWGGDKGFWSGHWLN